MNNKNISGNNETIECIFASPDGTNNIFSNNKFATLRININNIVKSLVESNVGEDIYISSISAGTLISKSIVSSNIMTNNVNVFSITNNDNRVFGNIPIPIASGSGGFGAGGVNATDSVQELQ